MMLRNDDQAWDECPDAESCELIHSFLELVDSMVRDIQHLKAETIRARYELSQKYDREHTWITTVQIATFCGQQGRISRTVRAILSGQFEGTAGLGYPGSANQY